MRREEGTYFYKGRKKKKAQRKRKKVRPRTLLPGKSPISLFGGGGKKARERAIFWLRKGERESLPISSRKGEEKKKKKVKRGSSTKKRLRRKTRKNKNKW